MEAAVVNAYSGLMQRFATGFLLNIVALNQGQLVNPVNHVPATMLILILVFAENYLEGKIHAISQPRLVLLKDLLSNIFIFVGSLLAYLLIALIIGFFQDDLGSVFTISSGYRIVILIVSISLISTLGKFFAGELQLPAEKKE